MSISNTTTSKKDFPLFEMIATFAVIVATRVFLDNVAYPYSGNYFFEIGRLTHAMAYFFSILLSFSIATYFLTKAPFEKILPFAIKALLFIAIIPVIDFGLKGSLAEELKYLTVNSNELWETFVGLVSPSFGHGTTTGQRIGAAGIFISLAIFVFKNTRSFTKSILSLLASYCVLFIYATMPSILLLLSSSESLGKSDEAIRKYAFLIKNSWITHSLNGHDISFTAALLNQLHEATMARAFWVLLILQAAFVFYVSSRHIWNSFKHNLRTERIIYWFIIGSIGFIISEKLFGKINLLNSINFLSLLIFLFLIVLNIWLAVLINDEEDIDIDSISNPDRPLVKKSISQKEWFTMKMTLILLIILGISTMTMSVAFPIMLFQGMYYIYSVGPLKLKKNFITSSLIIGFASVFIAMAGFFLVSPNQQILAFPLKATLIIFIAYALLSNLKDIKDFEGDTQAKIKTMPVVFGLKNSKIIISLLCASVIIGIPFILKIPSIIFIATCIAIFLFYLFTKKEYQEKYIFLTFFVYILALFFASR